MRNVCCLFKFTGTRDETVALMAEHGYVTFHHRNDLDVSTRRHYNDLFVRKDIVEKYHVVQLE